MLDRNGQVIAEHETTATASRRLEGSTAFDVSNAPAGGYNLELKAWQEGDSGALLRIAHFSVAWQQESWLRNPGDVSDDVHFLLEPADEDSFALLHPGEQEQELDQFWRERDPTPETADNEARNLFRQRVDYANRQYTRAGLGKGMFSDMGRTYIRYGEPGEVVHQVIPTGDETLDRVLAELSATEDRAVGDVPHKGPGGDIRPFELWIYEGDIGLPPDADPHAIGRTRRKRLVFLFVDEHGLGDYRLRYTNE
jgi:GWxTD domain-containing protein